MWVPTADRKDVLLSLVKLDSHTMLKVMQVFTLLDALFLNLSEWWAHWCPLYCPMGSFVYLKYFILNIAKYPNLLQQILFWAV